MSIDTSMYNALMQRPKSAMEYENEFANADYVREQRGFERQRNALAMQTAQDAAAERTRQRGEQEGVRNALAGLGADTAPERQIGALRALGTQTALTQADALEKGWIERRKGAAAAGKDEQEITGKRLSMFRDFLPQVATPEDAIRWTRAQYADPVVGPVVSGLGTFEQAVAGIPQDPEKFGEWRNATAMGIEKYLAHMQQERQIAETGRHNRAGEAISVRGQDVSAATARRGQDMNDARARETNATSREGARVQVINDPERGVLLVDKGTGLVRPGVGLNGQPVAGESAVKRQGSAARSLALLDEADRLIGESTGSYLGAGVDLGAQVFGKATQGAQAAAQLKVLEGQLMMAQPRMEGPQSNLDVDLYRQMAGRIGDPTVPAEMKRSALKTIRGLAEKYAGGTSRVTGPVAPAGGAGVPPDIAAILQKHGGR